MSHQIKVVPLNTHATGGCEVAHDRLLVITYGNKTYTVLETSRGLILLDKKDKS